MLDALARWRAGGGRAELLPYLVIVAVALIAVAGLALRPEPGSAPGDTDYVIVAGAPGLQWQDLDPQRTPHLWRLAETGAIGSMSVRSAHQPTCPVDGWLTLGAGNWATGTTGPREGPCGQWDVTVETPDSTSAFVPEQPTWVRYNQGEQPWGAVLGTLAGSVRCTVAVGEGAAVAAARSYGGVDWYAPELPARTTTAAGLLARCVLGIVDLGAVTGSGGARAVAVAWVEAALGQLLAARPDDSLLLVAGVADTGAEPRLHAAIADGPGVDRGWLTSGSTGRAGFLQLVDLTPTAVATLDRPPPEPGRLAGHPALTVPGRPDELATAVADLVAMDAEARRTEPVAGGFLAGLTAVQLMLLAGVVPLLRRPWRGAIGWWRLIAPVLLVAAALAVPAALAAGVAPWWRTAAAAASFGMVAGAALAAGTLLLVRTPVFRHTLGLVGGCAGVAAVVIAADLVTGGRLQLGGVVGYSPHDGLRFAGVSAIGLGVLAAGTLLAAGCLAQQVARRWRPVAVVAVGAVGVVLVGSPYLGADPAGAMALTAGVCLTAAMCTGGWLTVSRLAWALLAGAAVTVAVGLVDLWRPVEQRDGLGEFVTALTDGTARYAVRRVSLANTDALLASPLTVLAIGAVGFAWLALLRPWGGLRRLFGIYPALRAGMMGTLVAAVLAGLLTGSALTVAGAAGAVAAPLVTLAALRVREQAAARAVDEDDPASEPSQVLG